MPRTNDDVAATLRELADLLEISGDDRFRILTYRRAADAISVLSSDIGGLSERELVAVRGVGKGIAAKVTELLQTGKLETLDELRRRIPEGVRLLTNLPGVGPKRARLVHTELGVSSLDDLREAAEGGRIRGLRGLGPKVEENILRALADEGRRDDRVPLGRALALAEEMVAELGSHDAVLECAYAGSLRRMRDTIGDIDLLASSERPDEVMDAFRGLGPVARVLVAGETKSSVVTAGGLQVDLRVVGPDSYGAALQYFTGSQAHNVKVREHAVRAGLKLSEYGLDTRAGRRLAGRTEHEVYERLGMQWVPPPMREDTGEVELALGAELPTLVEVSDIRGDLQSHSTWSDGKATLAEMVVAAAGRGYEYYAITDHGRRLALKSLSVEDIAAQRREVDELNAVAAGRMTVLHGVELNIGRSGELDYADEILERFDVIVASVHHQLGLGRDEQTRRIVRAIEHPYVNVIGHPTGRILGRRLPYELDFPAVFEAAVRHGVALEISGHPGRLDLRDEHVRWARERGVRFAISTDAHSPAELGNVRLGVGTAQRAWVTPGEVITTWPLKRLRTFLRKGRR